MFGRKTKPVLKPDPLPAELVALKGTVAALEHQWKTVETEWTEMYDKFRRLHMRLTKRDQREREGTVEETQPEATTPPNPIALAMLRGHS